MNAYESDPQPGHQASLQASPRECAPTLPSVPPAMAFIGIDNGFTGAVAIILPDGKALFEPAHVMDLGKERLLDLDAKGYNKSQVEGINDALCIALCAREAAHFQAAQFNHTIQAPSQTPNAITP